MNGIRPQRCNADIDFSMSKIQGDAPVSHVQFIMK